MRIPFSRSLRALLDHEEPDFNEVFDLPFVVNISLFGETKEIELKPDGVNVRITQENKAEYVKVASKGLSFEVTFMHLFGLRKNKTLLNSVLFLNVFSELRDGVVFKQFL